MSYTEVVFSAMVVLLALGCVCPSSMACFIGGVLVVYVCKKIIEGITNTSVTSEDRGVFITGCDTGFGHDLARRLDDIGFTVFAGCLKPNEEGARKLKSGTSERLHIVPLDVGLDESVESAHAYVLQHLPKNGLWAIVNNAGFNVPGDVELLTVGLYQKAMNVNFYGAVRVIRRFLHLVRKMEGRVVNVSSVRGRIPWPSDSAYHVTKHALETMSDSLRLEMRKFNVKVSVVEPGGYGAATACNGPEHFARYIVEADEMWRCASEDVKRTYGRQYIDRWLKTSTYSAPCTGPVIDALEDAIIRQRPRSRYLVPGGATTSGFSDHRVTLSRLYPFLPTWISDNIIVWMSGCDKLPEK